MIPDCLTLVLLIYSSPIMFLKTKHRFSNMTSLWRAYISVLFKKSNVLVIIYITLNSSWMINFINWRGLPVIIFLSSIDPSYILKQFFSTILASKLYSMLCTYSTYVLFFYIPFIYYIISRLLFLKMALICLLLISYLKAILLALIIRNVFVIILFINYIKIINIITFKCPAFKSC